MTLNCLRVIPFVGRNHTRRCFDDNVLEAAAVTLYARACGTAGSASPFHSTNKLQPKRDPKEITRQDITHTDAKQWEHFVRLVKKGANYRKECRAPLTKAGVAWGIEKIRHYGFLN